MNNAQKKAAIAIDALLAQADKIAMELVEQEARRILRAGAKGRNPARSFCMGMGVASFYDRTGMFLDEYHPAVASFYEFLYDYNSRLKLTGGFLKLETWDGPAITE